MTKDEALKMALETLERSVSSCFTPFAYEEVMCIKHHFVNETITAIKEALAQPEQEPLAWMDDYNACKCSDNETRCFSDRVFRMMQKYTAPPKRKWVGLTDEELSILGESFTHPDEGIDEVDFGMEIQRILKEKNA